MKEEIIDKLILEFANNTISEVDLSVLICWYEESNTNKNHFKLRLKELKKLDYFYKWQKINQEVAWSKIKPQTKKINFGLLKYVAASVIILIFIAITLLRIDKSNHVLNLSEIKPAQNKAILYTSDGDQITLEENKIIKIKEIEGTSISANNKGEIIYNKTKFKSEKLVYNTLKIPKGGVYKIKLSDNTIVWLNSYSELKYPVNFIGNNREVFLKGEAIFDVTPNKQKPFIVHSENTKIKVLGTVFNVRNYNTSTCSKVTLVEGKVNITNQNNSVDLLPNLQAIVDDKTNKINIKKVDVNLYTSWREGKFIFKEMSMKMITEELNRWYNIEFEFKNKALKQEKFTGILDRKKTLEYILNIIENTNDIKFETNEGKIIIK